MMSGGLSMSDYIVKEVHYDTGTIIYTYDTKTKELETKVIPVKPLEQFYLTVNVLDEDKQND